MRSRLSNPRPDRDREIETLIKRWKRPGPKSITDGENRRKSWQIDFIAALPGIEYSLGRHGRNRLPGSACSRNRCPSFAWGESLAPSTDPPDDRALRLCRRRPRCDAEDDDPVAVVAAFPLWPRRRAGFDLPRHGGFYRDLGQTYRKVVRALLMPAAAICKQGTRSTRPFCDPGTDPAGASTAARTREELPWRPARG